MHVKSIITDKNTINKLLKIIWKENDDYAESDTMSSIHDRYFFLS